MAIINKNYLTPQEEDIYFQKFVAKNGDEYGLRFGKPKDAKSISMIFKEIYHYEYLTPLVYNLDLLRRELAHGNNFWFVGELLENKEIAGTGLIKKNRYIALASKAVVRKKFQGLGVATKLGAAGILNVIKMPQFNGCLRLNIEVRANQIKAQKLIRNSGAVPFSLIPSYLNYGDKRFFKINDNSPFPPMREEAAFLYSIIFNTLWRKRERKIFMLDNEDFIFFYDFMKSYFKKMNKDVLILEKSKKSLGHELYGISKDHYEGLVNLYGYIKEKSLKNILKNHKKWRIILWRIPTTQNGIHSMALALEKRFNIVGYDIGFTNVNWTLYDSIIVAYYPNGGSHVLNVKCLDENKPLLNKIREIFFSRIN